MVAKSPLYPRINPISGSSTQDYSMGYPSLDGFEIGELYKGNQDFVTRFASVEVGEYVQVNNNQGHASTHRDLRQRRYSPHVRPHTGQLLWLDEIAHTVRRLPNGEWLIENERMGTRIVSRPKGLNNQE